MDESFIAPALFVTALAGILGLGIYASHKSEQRWETFKVEHQCKKVGTITPSTGVGVSPKGEVVTTVIPGKTGWACDDGQTYWR